MTDYSKRVYEMLLRVLVFRSNHPELFGQDSPADQLFRQLDALFKEMSAHSTSQASEKNGVRLSSRDRNAARAGLQTELESIARTAASIGLPGFYMPRGRADLAILEAAQIFVHNAEPFKKEFIANHLRQDFIDRLKTGIDALQRSIRQQAGTKTARKAATLEVEKVRGNALAVLTRLDPIIDNLLRDNLALNAAWDSARKVEKAARPKKASAAERTAGASFTVVTPAQPAELARAAVT